MSTYFFLPALLLFGFISAFLGHHFFRFHLAAYSFFFFGFVTIIVVGDVSQLSLANTVWFAAGTRVGVGSGCGCVSPLLPRQRSGVAVECDGGLDCFGFISS